MSQHLSASTHLDVLTQDIKAVQSNFNEILSSGHHYYTQEIVQHIKHINNALDNIKIEQEFQRGSKNWAKQFDSDSLSTNRNNFNQLISQGKYLSQELNTCLHTTNLKNKEENQLRELHSWACDSLIGYLQALEPFAAGSYARLDNLAHHLGVTDRYIGYRHNLTRGGNQPLHVHTVWADRKLPRANTALPQRSSSTPDWKNYVHAFRHYGPPTTSSAQQSQMANHQQHLLGYMQPKQTAETPRQATTAHYTKKFYPQETGYEAEIRKAGINLTFPGTTEFMDRYEPPAELPYSPFTVNPQPNYTLPGRPLARLVPESSPSEYTHSYVFPDASKVEKYPWLRSW